MIEASSGPTFTQLDGVMEWSARLDEVLERVEGVCETCDGHDVNEGCYFLCLGDSECHQIITPICNGCKWMEKKRLAQAEADNDQTD